MKGIKVTYSGHMGGGGEFNSINGDNFAKTAPFPIWFFFSKMVFFSTFSVLFMSFQMMCSRGKKSDANIMRNDIIADDADENK